MNTRFRKFSKSKPKAKSLTAAQIEANRKAFDEAKFTVVGRHAKGALVADLSGEVYRLTTIGFSYHEDVSSRIYGAAKARAPKEYTATRALRKVIEDTLRNGTHTPGSRGLAFDAAGEAPPPAKGTEWKSWKDGKMGSLASFPYIEVYDDIVYAVRPNYDDSPTVAWVQDAKLVKQVLAWIEISPQPYFGVTEVSQVKARAPKMVSQDEVVK